MRWMEEWCENVGLIFGVLDEVGWLVIGDEGGV